MASNWDWDLFWIYLSQMPAIWRDQEKGEKVQVETAKQLHLEEWLLTLPPKVQATVLFKAPDSVITILFFKRIITADTIGKLVKAGRKVSIPEEAPSKTRAAVSKSGYRALTKKKG